MVFSFVASAAGVHVVGFDGADGQARHLLDLFSLEAKHQQCVEIVCGVDLVGQFRTGQKHRRVLFSDLQQYGHQTGLLDLHENATLSAGLRTGNSIPLSRITVRLCCGV